MKFKPLTDIKNFQDLSKKIKLNRKNFENL